jgi:hypothetical protein
MCTRGFQLFGIHVPPKSIFNPFAYPQIKVERFMRTPPKSKVYPQIMFLTIKRQNWFYLSIVYYLAYPLKTAGVPQVENRWSKLRQNKFIKDFTANM